jgi:hypothetical protein
MKRILSTMVGAGILVACGAPSASAQAITWTDNVFVNVSAGGQIRSQNLDNNFAFPLFDETATVDVTRKVGNGPLFDITGGVHLTGHIGVAVSYSHYSHNSDGALTASIPDPIFFDSPRTVTGSVAGMAYSENVFAPLFVYAIPLTDKIDMMILAGPAVGRISEDVVSDVSETEAAGGPQVAVTRGSTSKSYVGGQAGVDLRYMLTKQVGVGGFVRYNGARGHVSGNLKAEVGGVQLGGGLRLRF